MTLRDDVLAAVPIGFENGLSARHIWRDRMHGQWLATSVRWKLNELAKNGAIERSGEGPAALFYRKAAP